MTWEEYQNTDAYKESHPDWNKRPTKVEVQIEQMRRAISLIDEYRTGAQLADEKEQDEGKIVCYITAITWNGRICGCVCCGSFEDCVMAMYEYNVQNWRDEYQFAVVERISSLQKTMMN